MEVRITTLITDLVVVSLIMIRSHREDSLAVLVVALAVAVVVAVDSEAVLAASAEVASAEAVEAALGSE